MAEENDNNSGLSDVLGVDPTPATPPAPAAPPAPAPAAPAAPDPSQVTIDAQELNTLRDAAHAYTTLIRDDGAREAIANHVRQRMAGTPAEPPAPATPSPSPGDQVGQELAQLRGMMREGAQHIQRQNQHMTEQAEQIKALQTDLFARDNPDFAKNQVAVAKVMEQAPGISREDALILVQARAAQAGNGTENGAPSPAPTSEGGSTGEVPSQATPSVVSEEGMAELARLVNDPKATPSTDAAVDAIGRAMGLDI